MVLANGGTLGVPEHARDHAIVVAAASPHIPRPLVERLAQAVAWYIRSGGRPVSFVSSLAAGPDPSPRGSP
jgi:protein-L-isoaspartate O-methyltransferase